MRLTMYREIIKNNFPPNFSNAYAREYQALWLDDHRFDPAGRLSNDYAYSAWLLAPIIGAGRGAHRNLTPGSETQGY